MKRRPQKVRQKVSPRRAQTVPLSVAVDKRASQPVLSATEGISAHGVEEGRGGEVRGGEGEGGS